MANLRNTSGSIVFSNYSPEILEDAVNQKMTFDDVSLAGEFCALVTLTDVNFQKTKFDISFWRDVTFNNVIFPSDLKGVKFTNCKFVSCRFTKSYAGLRLTGNNKTKFKNCSFRKSDINALKFSDIKHINCDFIGALRNHHPPRGYWAMSGHLDR